MIVDLYRHLRRILGERQTEHALPQCADPACARIFVRTRPGQALCQRCEDATREAEASIVPLEIWRGRAAK